jgi:hypothetical protein
VSHLIAERSRRTVSIPGFGVCPSLIRHAEENPIPADFAATRSSEWGNFLRRARIAAIEGIEDNMSRIVPDAERQALPTLQSDGEQDGAYRSDMAAPILSVIWKNLEDLMTARWGGPNLRRLAREAGIGPATMARLKLKDQNLGVEMLVKLGRPFRRQAWELLSPNLGGYSAEAAEIAAAFDELADEQKRRRAYALIVQILEFGNTGPLSGPPTLAPEPGPRKSPAAGQAAPSPTRSHGKPRRTPQAG